MCSYAFEENNLADQIVEIPKQQSKPTQQLKKPLKENSLRDKPGRLKRNDSCSSLDSDPSLSPPQS